MYYQNLSVTVPFKDRELINSKIISIIENPDLAPEVTKEEIYNSFTGIGGLHGLDRDDYSSYHQFSKAKKEIEQGQFFTPHGVCELITDLLQPHKDDLIADLCCGSGNFFNFLPNLKNVYGCELDLNAFKVAKYLYPDANISNMSIEYYMPDITFDLILGNPPFNLRFYLDKEEYVSQLHYILKSAQLLKKGGLLALIVPTSFLNDDFFNKTDISLIDDNFNFIVQYALDPKTFKHLGVSNFGTKIMVFQKKSQYLEDKSFIANQFFTGTIEALHNEIIFPVLRQKHALKSKLLNELYSDKSASNYSFKSPYFKDSVQYVQFSNNKPAKKIDCSNGFEFKLKKYLYEIKTHKITQPYYTKCYSYFEKFINQRPPVNCTNEEYKEWERNKITEQMVLAYFLKVIKKQNPVKQTDTIKLVHSKYDVYLKAYSKKASHLLSKHQYSKKESFIDIVAHDKTMPSINITDPYYRSIKKLIDKKRKDFTIQTTSFLEMDRSEKIDHFLTSFEFRSKNKTCNFSKKQIDDLGLILQKRYSILNWQQGSGKTPGSYAWSKYFSEKYNLKNTFILSSAISVKLTWTKFLTENKQSFIYINSISDINKIQKGQYVLLSADMLIRYYKHLAKYVKKQSHNVAFIFDESDEITNNGSLRSKASKAVFSKCKVKLLATGTTTRNNIAELYSQLELLYNNSINFLCRCETIFKEVNIKKEDCLYEELAGVQIKESDNNYFNLPFPARYGNNLFKYCFNPTKSTVFGIKKHNQDIYNIDQLRDLLEYTIITRKFADIVGPDKYSIVNHRIDQSPDEQTLYLKILKETSEMIAAFYSSTGNSKKDSMLRIIRQLQMLITATTCPQHFEKGIFPEKMNYITGLINKWDNEKVTVGFTFKETLEYYKTEVFKQFPFRQLFVITGETTFKQRERLIAEFQGSANGILLCTQQSLKNSVNIGTCNKAIIESLQWNIPKMEQFYFRFIRFDSLHATEVHFVNYNDTIEFNILALLMSKERINDFIKSLTYKEQSDIFNEFDISLDILNSIIEKEYDKDGKVQLTWGKQKVS